MRTSTILGLTTALFAASSVNAVESLKSRAGNLKIGVAAASQRFSNQAYTSALSNFNYMVAENACKLSGIQQQKGVYNYADCDAHLAKATELGMAFRFHCLVWHSYQPSWFEGSSGEGLKNAIVDHITNVMKHYEGKVDSWDVVNEAIDDSSNGQGWQMRKSFLYNGLPDFVDLAFKTARQVSPTAKLFYNDYNTEGIYQKSESVYNFVADMKKRGIPIDGVGLQYHVSTSNKPAADKITSLIGRYCQLGVEVHITEMDVKNEGGGDQGEVYATAMKACLANSCCTGFLVWGVGDSDSWLGESAHALLFDSQYQPKASYTALLNAMGSGGNQQSNTPNAGNTGGDTTTTTKTLPDLTGGNTGTDGQTTKTLPDLSGGNTGTDGQTTKTLPDLSGGNTGTKTLPDLSGGNTGTTTKTLPNLSGTTTKTLPNLSGTATKTLPDLTGVNPTGTTTKTLPDLTGGNTGTDGQTTKTLPDLTGGSTTSDTPSTKTLPDITGGNTTGGDNNNNGGNPWGGNAGGNPWGGDNNNGGNPWGGNAGGNPWGGDNNNGGNPWGGNNGGGNPWGNWGAPSNSASGGENCAGLWGQCGGNGYNGPTCCSQGTCKSFGEYFSQCIQ